jgi:hypothetical protein
MEYLHPSIATRIIDNSIIFMAAQGLTNLYSVITADKGKDNVVQYMTSPTEFLFEYGNPSIGKHGQQNNNLYQWLNTSGGAYVLRVLPPDATYANLVYELNYKLAAPANGDNTNSHLYFKPAFNSFESAKTRDMVETYLTTKYELTSEGLPVVVGNNKVNLSADTDGFTVKRIVAFLPKARGKYYENLGVKMSVVDNYDSTYDFRLFNIEVVEKFPGGGYSTVEGPYLVSFAPDAISLSQESLYISNVMSKYSKYFEAVVNQSALDDIAAVIDTFNAMTFPSPIAGKSVYSDVNPNLIDILTGTHLNKTNGVRYVNAYKAVLDCGEGVDADLNKNEQIIITLENSDGQQEKFTITAGATLATAEEIAIEVKKVIDPSVNYEATVIGGRVAITNIDSTETFKVIGLSLVVANPSPISNPNQLIAAVKITKAIPLVSFLNSSSLEVISELSDPNDPKSPKKSMDDIAAEYMIELPAGSELFSGVQSLNDISFLQNGSDGKIFTKAEFDLLSPAEKTAAFTKDMLLARGFGQGGYIDPTVTNKKEVVIDVVMDSNYNDSVKGAIVTFCSEIRGDCIAIIDTNFTATPQQALDWRKLNPFSTFYASIFTQDFIVDDAFSGSEIKVTSTYFLASKIPNIDEQYGLQYPFVGPRRGTISGFKKMSWNPTEPQKELLYKRQINYVESDIKRTKFGSQLTSQTVVSALSNINAVRTLLRIKRDVETLAEDYQFEFGDPQTYSNFQYNLNTYLQRWVANRACSIIKGQVYASAYDKQQKIARVRIDLTFNYVIERILIDLVVNR